MQALQSFRSIYPDSTVCMVSNNGMDLSHVAEYFECDYAHSDKAASTISTYCPDEDSFKLYMERLYTTAKKAKEDYVMILSEDVRIFKPLRTLKYDLNGGRGYWKGKLIKGAQAIFPRFSMPYNKMRAGGDGIILRKQFILDHFGDIDRALKDLAPDIKKFFRHLPAQFPSDGIINMLVLYYGGTIGPYHEYTDVTKLDYLPRKALHRLTILHGETGPYNKKLTEKEESILEGKVKTTWRENPQL